MRRLLMLEEQKAWKREAGFDYIETAAEMDARRSRSNVVPETFFYRNIFNPRRPHTPDKLTLEMKVDVERLRTEITLSQRALRSQCDPSPRRLPAVDSGSEKPETLRLSPRSVGGRTNPEYRELRQRSGNKLSLLKSVWMVFCALTAQTRTRRIPLFCIDQTSE